MSVGAQPPSAGSMRRHVRKILALGLMVTAYAFSRLPEPSVAEREAAAARFAFDQRPIPIPGRAPLRGIRAVHPSLDHIAGWISAVGAAVSLADLDGNGRPDDACVVDTRTDDVLVSHLGREAREPFALQLEPWMDRRTMAPMGCLPGDLDEDGQTDLLVYFWGRTPVLFVRASAAWGAAAYRPRPLVEPDERWFTNAATRADLDGDGHVDIVFANYFPDGAAILDASGDGIESMQASMSRARNGGRKHVFLFARYSNGGPDAVPYRRVPDALPDEASNTWTLALGAADLDGDLLPELYFANDFGEDTLLHNASSPGNLRFQPLHGRRTLTTPRSKVLGRDSFKGMGVDFADLNRDGLADIFVNNIAAPFALQESHFVFVSTGDTALMQRGVAPYVDRSEPLGLARSGWAWDVKVDDFDNDGRLEVMQASGFLSGSVSRWPELQELATGNDQVLHDPRSWPPFKEGADLSGSDRNAFFVRHEDGRYYDIAADLGLPAGTVSRGIAIADLDDDGRLDFAVANQWQAPSLFENRSPNPGAFVGLRLLRPLDANERFVVVAGRPVHLRPATPAIGAEARVRLADGTSLVRQVDGGNGHSGKRAPELHFGLDTAEHAPGGNVRVDLRWRDARGALRTRGVTLQPGWHTVILGR